MVPFRPLSQRDARIIRRSHYLGLHVEEGDHFVKRKIVFRPLIHLFATAVEDALDCHHLCAVQVQCFTEANEVFFIYR